MSAPFDPSSYLRWHRLTHIERGGEVIEMLAATHIDGIGCIARWTRRDDGGWDVEAMDTEGTAGMQPVDVNDEDECVPSTPPTVFDDK